MLTNTTKCIGMIHTDGLFASHFICVPFSCAALPADCSPSPVLALTASPAPTTFSLAACATASTFSLAAGQLLLPSPWLLGLPHLPSPWLHMLYLPPFFLGCLCGTLHCFSSLCCLGLGGVHGTLACLLGHSPLLPFL